MNPRIFQTTVSLDVYCKRGCDELGTQAAYDRRLKVLKGYPFSSRNPVFVRLCEDGYEGWLKPGAYLDKVLRPATYKPNKTADRATIVRAIPSVLAFLFEAMQTPNQYLWGGTVGPNFDCSGLVQTAFAGQGIWLPRDARKQCKAPCTMPVDDDKVEPGDLLFFSRSQKIDHVGIHLGNWFYIHSSGKNLGRDGIGIDRYSKDAKNARGVGANYSPIYLYSRRVCASLDPGN
jgi:cell wall-associated NlpC family hydrolase